MMKFMGVTIDVLGSKPPDERAVNAAKQLFCDMSGTVHINVIGDKMYVDLETQYRIHQHLENRINAMRGFTSRSQAIQSGPAESPSAGVHPAPSTSQKGEADERSTEQ